MKPSNTALNTDFYHLANDGGIEVVINLHKGTMTKLLDGTVLATRIFSVGNPLSDYSGLIYNSKTASWRISLIDVLFSPTTDHIANGNVATDVPGMVVVNCWRQFGNQFKVTVEYSGLGGYIDDSYYIRLKEDIEIRVRVKTFLQPEL